jgi:membrane-associated phospholipid phosphatase
MLKILFALFLFFPNKSYSASNPFFYAEDYFQYIPLMYATGLTVYHKDLRGAAELAGSTAITVGSTYALKYAVGETRPSGKSNDSFPSGHTAMSFVPTAFIAKRYGLLYSLPALGFAVATGVLRVQHHQHYWWDVVGGAVLGTALGYFISSEYQVKDKKITINASPRIGGAMLSFGLNF